MIRTAGRSPVREPSGTAAFGCTRGLPPAAENRSPHESCPDTAKDTELTRASRETAVVWSKPDDIEYNETAPIAGVVGLQTGGFLTAF